MEINQTDHTQLASIPLLPLRGVSVFPGMMLNFDVERPFSVAALNTALAGDRMIMLLAQKDLVTDTPGPKDLYKVGTICRLKQMLRIPGVSAVRVMVEGLARGRVTEYLSESPSFLVSAETLPDKPVGKAGDRAVALIRRCGALFEEYIRLTGSLSPEALLNILSNPDPAYVSNFVTQNVFLDFRQKQLLLEEVRPLNRLALLCDYLNREIHVLGLEHSIQESAQEQMNQNQKDYFLREQLKAIQNELGEGDDLRSESEEYRERIAKAKLAPEIEEKLLREVTRLSKQPFGSSESAVLRNYLDTCLELPWNTATKEVLDIEKAGKVLDADHFGLEKVKERILEYLAVRKISPAVSGGVLCLVGPPGTGKTSVAQSIARATNRRLARISLGGIHDESEIRGHRKTYVGAMPGRIINGIIQAGSSNPLLLLDEIDKLGRDFRGDPAAALLEVLDFAQNSTFRDHFLEIPFDLSKVLFITTANTTSTIPPALRDRMEIIEISSYTDEEKLQIAQRHLLSAQRKKHGLKPGQLKVTDGAMREIITLYTRESGVRQLERELAKVCRKAAKSVATGERKSVTVRPDSLETMLGVVKYKPEPFRGTDEVGLVHGLAWTSVGGDILDVEVAIVDGSGRLELTGNLGDVMKESARAAITYIRSRAAKLEIDPDFHKDKDIHIHFPEGAVPKDGPSAGITMCIAVISALTGIPVRRDIAMTGEITLRGRILPIGGLREKTMAALRNGINTVIIPAENEKDLADIDPAVRDALNFITADHVDKILDLALRRDLRPEAPKTVPAPMPQLPPVAMEPGPTKPSALRQ